MLAMILGHLANIRTTSAACYSYILASIGILRLAQRYFFISSFLDALLRLSCSVSLFIPLALPGSLYKETEISHNCTTQAYLSKAPLFRTPHNDSTSQWFSTIIMIYTRHFKRRSYTLFYFDDWYLKLRSLVQYSVVLGHPFRSRQSLLFLVLHILGWLTVTRDTTWKSPLLLPFYVFSYLRSAFNFLRCPGPRRLRSSRRVLVDCEEYQIMKVGRGAFATITRVLHKPTGDIRVMKRIVFDKAGLAKEVAQAEVDSLNAMAGNLWFPTLLNHFTDDEEFIITMPFYARGDMASLIQYKGYLGTELARFYCAELILAIQCLHKQGIVHRDIKPENIFFDEGGHLILADLGLAENIGTFLGTDVEMGCFPIWKEAKKIGGEDYPFLWADRLNPLGTKGIAGTYWYTAPEVFRNERYSFGVDYYSVGIIYCELVTGNIPFEDSEPYPENKRPVVDFRQKPGQLKRLAPWEERAVFQIAAPDSRDRPQTVSKLKDNSLFVGVNWKTMASRDLRPPALPLPLCG